METAKFSSELKGLLWAECMSTTTLLTNLTTYSANEGNKSSNEMLYGENSPIVKSLKGFGSKAYVTERGLKGKLDRKSKKCIMVGYAENHTNDCYRLYNPETQRIILSRDIIWDEKGPVNEIEYQVIERSDNDREEFKDNMESGEATVGKILPTMYQLQSLYAAHGESGVNFHSGLAILLLY